MEMEDKVIKLEKISNNVRKKIIEMIYVVTLQFLYLF